MSKVMFWQHRAIVAISNVFEVTPFEAKAKACKFCHRSVHAEDSITACLYFVS